MDNTELAVLNTELGSLPCQWKQKPNLGPSEIGQSDSLITYMRKLGPSLLAKSGPKVMGLCLSSKKHRRAPMGNVVCCFRALVLETGGLGFEN